MKTYSIPDVKTQAIRKRHRTSFPLKPGKTKNFSLGHSSGDTPNAYATKPIPLYSKTTRVLSYFGRLDKVAVTMDLGYIDFEYEEDTHAFWFYLGAPPIEQRGLDVAAVFGTLFKSTPFKGKQRFPLEVRRQSVEYDIKGEKLESPLFSSGCLGGKWEKHANGEGVHCHLKIVPWAPLKLNPTRAMNHRVSELTNESGLSWQEQLFRRKKEEVLHSADANDNVVESSLDQDTYRKAERKYLTIVVYSMIEEINRAHRTATDTPEYDQGSEGIGDPYRCPAVGLKSITLNECETYWEMEVPNASEFISSIKDTLLSYGSAARARFGNVECDEESLNANSRSLLIRLGNGESIRIYAKLTDRVRFEVIHDPKQQSNLLPSGRTINSVDDFLGMLEKLKQRAAPVLNDLLDYLATWSEAPPQTLAASKQYVERWEAAFGTQEHSLSVYKLLRTNGRVVGGISLPKDQRRTLRTANRRGLVNFHNGAFYPAGE